MKFKITQAVNRFDGNAIFHVYEWDIANEMWRHLHGTAREEDARAYIDRALNPVPEKVIAEIEG